MKHASEYQRPFDRIDHLMSRLKRLWHYYPAHPLPYLVMEITIYANREESNLPLVSMQDIEDIAYPDGHYCARTRHLETGIDWLETLHADEPLPPVPFQIGVLDDVAATWRKHPQMRLGQLLLIYQSLAEHREVELSANGTR